jgi:hypothetical protein
MKMNSTDQTSRQNKREHFQTIKSDPGFPIINDIKTKRSSCPQAQNLENIILFWHQMRIEP